MATMYIYSLEELYGDVQNIARDAQVYEYDDLSLLSTSGYLIFKNQHEFDKNFKKHIYTPEDSPYVKDMSKKDIETLNYLNRSLYTNIYNLLVSSNLYDEKGRLPYSTFKVKDKELYVIVS